MTTANHHGGIRWLWLKVDCDPARLPTWCVDHQRLVSNTAKWLFPRIHIRWPESNISSFPPMLWRKELSVLGRLPERVGGRELYWEGGRLLSSLFWGNSGIKSGPWLAALKSLSIYEKTNSSVIYRLNWTRYFLLNKVNVSSLQFFTVLSYPHL